jgi:hypothetical protein
MQRRLVKFDNQLAVFHVVPPSGGCTAVKPPEGGTTKIVSLHRRRFQGNTTA